MRIRIIRINDFDRFSRKHKLEKRTVGNERMTPRKYFFFVLRVSKIFTIFHGFSRVSRNQKASFFELFCFSPKFLSAIGKKRKNASTLQIFEWLHLSGGTQNQCSHVPRLSPKLQSWKRCYFAYILQRQRKQNVKEPGNTDMRRRNFISEGISFLWGFSINPWKR